ncbi:MAG: glycine radical domain-containing protein, partial [Planctomycetota bacterium]|nr:glycine radical domain-containing protein [Planctomycetota bacterium]
PAAFEGEDAPEKLASLIEVYFKKGGLQVQANLLDAETLQQARQNPAQYADLQVRVTGFSAYFTSLEDDVQEMLVGRAG